jgi:hypothetical protein
LNTASRPWPIWLRALQVLGAVWTLPNTLIGLIGGLAGMLGGATLRWSGRLRAGVRPLAVGAGRGDHAGQCDPAHRATTWAFPAAPTRIRRGGAWSR